MWSRTSRLDRPVVRGDASSWIRLMLALAACGLATVPAVAQVSTGNISGYVKDTSGAAIPTVTLTAKMVEQQTNRTAQTNSEGFYDLLALPPGNISGYVKDTSGAAIPTVTLTAKMVEQQTNRTAQTNSEGFYDLLALPPGNISGYVKDTSGAAIPTVTLTAKMVEQQTNRTAQTNSEGFYDLLALPPGTYEITFEVHGFQKQTETGLELTVGQNLRVDANLQVGSVGTQVTVGAEAPLVDTTSATLSGLIDDRRIVDLPLNGRNVMGLAAILPGVLNVNAPQEMGDARGGPTMDVNGGRPNMNLFTFNGGYFNNPSRNTGINFPPPDAIEEVRIQTHNFSAEYGHNPGSQVNVISKAGTNQFHGAAWEFLRNSDLNARNFFSPNVPTLRQNQFGAAGG